MKWLQSLLLAIFLQAAYSQVPLSVDSLKDANGVDLKNVVITEAGPDGIKLVDAAGVGKLPWDQVPADIRQKLGWTEGKVEEVDKLKQRVAKAEAAIQAAAIARAEAVKRKARPTIVRLTCKTEVDTGTEGIVNGKAALVLGVLGEQPGAVIEINAFKVPSRASSASVSTFVPVNEFEIVGLKADRERLLALSKGQGGSETMIGGLEINKRRAELIKANTATQLIRYRVTDVVYNGVLGVCDVGGRLVWVIGATADKSANLTSLVMPDGEQTVGGKKYLRFVTIK